MGQTYPHRNTFKSMSGYFVSHDKSWRFPYSENLLNDIDKFCRQQGGGASDNKGPENLTGVPSTPLGMTGASLGMTEPSTKAESNGYRVSEVLNLLEATISQSFSKPLWIIGEVQNLNIRSGRGIFFNLAEQANENVAGSTLSISAILWSETFKRLEKKLGQDKVKEILQDGLTLRVLCRVNFYKARASVSLSILDIDPEYTSGALALAREKLLKELRSKNLDQKNKKLLLSPFPFRVGLVSAENSRAASDFIDQLQQGKFCGEIIFCHASMQGENSPGEVCLAIKRLIERDCDIIVLTRGGGSAADLRWFDTAEIAYAIAGCSVPVLAAIGHHDDRCVAEEICHQREKTPTAAAEFILGCFERAEQRIEALVTRVQQSLEQVLTNSFERQNVLKERLKFSANQVLVKKQEFLLKVLHQIHTQGLQRTQIEKQKLAQAMQQIYWASKLRLEGLGQETVRLEQSLKGFDPRPWLEKGWTQLWTEQGLVQSVDDVNEGHLVSARLLDGLLKLRVEDKSEKKTG